MRRRRATEAEPTVDFMGTILRFADELPAIDAVTFPAAALEPVAAAVPVPVAPPTAIVDSIERATARVLALMEDAELYVTAARADADCILQDARLEAARIIDEARAAAAEIAAPQSVRHLRAA